jgi:hypothetical protein
MFINDRSVIRTIVTHAFCPDGLGSAMLLSNVFPEAEVFFAAYGDEAYKNLEPREGMVFCDIVPPQQRAHLFAAVEDIYVLDHHKGAADTVALFGNRGRFASEHAEPGVSGTTLAFRHVWQEWAGPLGATASVIKEVERFANLAGIRDTWVKDSPLWRAACAQSKALQLLQWQGVKGREWPVLGTTEEMIGLLLLEKTERDVIDIASRVERVQIGRLKVGLLTGDGLISDVAEHLGDQVDVLLGFNYATDAEGRRVLRMSGRTRGDFDLIPFMKRLGGGGHSKAAGCTIPVHPTDPNAFRLVEEAVRSFLQVTAGE